MKKKENPPSSKKGVSIACTEQWFEFKGLHKQLEQFSKELANLHN